MKKQLLLASTFICIGNLSAMDENKNLTHSAILNMIKEGKLEVHKPILFNGQQYTVAGHNIDETNGRITYRFTKPATFLRIFNLGKDILTTEDSLNESNKNPTSKEERIYNNTTRHLGYGLQYTSFGLGCLGLIYGIAKIFKIGE